MSAPEMRSSAADEATIDELATIEIPVSFWQRPFIQNVVPFCTSLALHAGVLVMGIATYQVVTRLGRPIIEQPSVAATEIMSQGDESILHGDRPGERRPQQPDFPDVKELDGLARIQGKNLNDALSGGTAGAGNGAADLTIGVNQIGPGGGTGVVGSGVGNGSPGGGAKIAPFGIPDGRGQDDGDRFFPRHGAKRIIFVLDATGSMMPSFDALRVQLRGTLQNMRPPQSFNIIFINDRNPPPLAPALLFATPENKRRAIDYVETMAPRGGTEPLPALEKAFAQQPELVFLLIDPTDVPDKQAVMDLVTAKAAGGKIKMNVIGFEGRDAGNEEFLKSLADRTGGRYSHVSKEDLMNP